eukprot:747135-Prymnesium_polylepis.1
MMMISSGGSPAIPYICTAAPNPSFTRWSDTIVLRMLRPRSTLIVVLSLSSASQALRYVRHVSPCQRAAGHKYQ